MGYPRERAEAFAVAMSAAWDDQRPDEFIWEAAARGSGIDPRDLRVVREGGLAFLIGGEWAVEMGDVGWVVREWEAHEDDLWDSANALGAFDEPEDADDPTN